MAWLETVRAFDFQLFELINDWAGKSDYLDAAGIFAAQYLIWVMAVAALIPLLKKKGASRAQEGAHAAMTRSWFFPSGSPAPHAAVSGAAGVTASAMGQRIRDGVALILAAVLAWGMRAGIGEWIGRVRPYEYAGIARHLVGNLTDPSFPSSHAAVSFALACAASYYAPALGVFLFIGAVCVAVARIFVGVHYPADVAAGALLGMVSAYVARWMVQKIWLASRRVT